MTSSQALITRFDDQIIVSLYWHATHCVSSLLLFAAFSDCLAHIRRIRAKSGRGLPWCLLGCVGQGRLK